MNLHVSLFCGVSWATWQSCVASKQPISPSKDVTRRVLEIRLDRLPQEHRQIRDYALVVSSLTAIFTGGDVFLSPLITFHIKRRASSSGTLREGQCF